VAPKRAVLKWHLVPMMGKMRLDEIAPRDLELFKAQKLREGKSPKTINNCLPVLRRLLVLAVEWGKLTHVPPVKWLKAPDPEFDFLTFEETERMVAAAETEWRPMIVAALKTGLRLGELLALRWDDVDLVAGRLVVRRLVARGQFGTPNSGKSREIPLSLECCES
jgi:integrase